ncbi:MAG: TIGR03118 family protein [Acidobacteriaceae bacterium]
MQFVIPSLRPWFVPACALALFPALASAQHYQQTNLVSNVPVTPAASISDPNLINPWGLVHSPTSPWWISNNAGGTSTLYNNSGLNPANPAAQTPPPTLVPVTIVALNAPGGTPGNGVVVPNAPGQPAPGSPTAVLFNGSTTNFLVAGKPATFLFATEDGTIQGWNSSVNPTTSIIEVDNSQVPSKGNGAVYKGATIISIAGNEYLLAANFRSGQIDVFDSNFKPVTLPEECFKLDGIPRGFAPFNVQGIGPNIYITFAQQDSAKHDEVFGAGLGFVLVFDGQGRRLARLEHGDWFNAPWGVALAPSDFGKFSHALLVGNFGSGTIAAFNPITGRFLGNMLNIDGSTVTIDGLWALVFGNGGSSGPGSTLFFTAGPDNETNGLFGTLTPLAAELQEDDKQ